MSIDGSNYFDINDILSTQQRLPCKVEMPIYRLGYLDSSSESEHLQPGTKLELPFWMARALCSRKRHIVSVDLPKQYKEGYREIFSADPTMVDLHKLGPYFYNYGSQLLQFELPETPDVAKSLLQTFQGRLRKIMDSSQNCFNEDTSKLVEKLDESERILFKEGQQALNDFQCWETRKTEKLKTSEMVKNHRKRKRVVLEET
ncbi:DNA replication complex GINS protein PSF3-like [Crassostrea angulata]|uniref:DNA replication complex GINS protein PSF3 n=1 Tax=Magallana gigas TaxID=29159 RepID=A0A8W8K965_MAGGI|nr:DNA replication complex GINS protein PSF3 [Crassostrea gigas]XP_052716588.1 DNA replication complex GINS protein PSF3-like [Crassostrea angulata]